MNRRFFMLLCIAALVLSAGSAVAAEKVWEMSMTSAYNDKHPTYINAWKPWIDTIDRETNGRVKIQYFNVGTLCPEGETLSSVASGIVTIGGHSQARNPGKYPYNEIIDLPLLTSNSQAGSLLSWAGFNKFPAMQAEEKEMKVLWHWSSAPVMLHTIKKPVKSLEDLKGMKIIAWMPSIMEVVRALGASPIQVAPPDTYLALQRGMADGVMCPLAPVRSFKIEESAKYTTLCNTMMGNFTMGINWDVWKSLPPDIQAVFEKNSGEKMTRMAGQSLDNGAAADLEILTKQGHTFITLDKAEMERWSAATAQIRDNWVKKMESKGFNQAAEMLTWHQEMGKKYAEEVAEKR